MDELFFLIGINEDEEGEPWFVAKDVCEILGLTNPTEAIRSIDPEDKSTLRISEGGPEVNIINESGLYTLIMRSNKPEAKQFKRWVTSEVLPSIRKHGAYMTPQAIETYPVVILHRLSFHYCQP